MNKTSACFGSHIKRRRIEQGLSIRGFAQKLDIGASYLCDIENGRRNPPDEPLLGQMADALGIHGGERALLYDMAGEARGEVPADLTPYVRGNDVVRVALRKAQDGAKEADWLRFIEQLEGKQRD